MIASSIDHHIRLQQVFWFALILLSAIAVGYFLATDFWFLAFLTSGFLWLLLLPYHAKLSIYVAVATFSSALIVPLFPGRPYLWEFAALLGWSGIVMTVAMRQYSADVMDTIVKHRWLFIGAFGYCLVLIVTMMYRGFGLRILGSGQVGGRYYFQQLSCVVFPLLFAMCPPKERTLVRLFLIQCILTTTYLVSDFVLSKAPEKLLYLLQVFELSGDAVNFEMRAERFGIRRFQSFYVVGLGFFLLLLVRNSLRDFFTRRGVIALPAALAVLGLGFLSGHRYLAVIVGGVLIMLAYAQKFVTMRNVFVTVSVISLTLIVTYLAADRLPMAAQRAISFLPGIQIDQQAQIDALSTLEVRRTLRRVGMEMAPQYFWIGRGFGLSSVDLSWQWDPTTITGHINQGRFYNGFVGLMVNTGFFGTVFMLMFLLAGVFLSFRIFRNLRVLGWDDDFLRLCGLMAGLWVANTIAFLLLHGDSEYAMKTFSLQAGMILVCHRHLERRMAELNQPVVVEEEPEPVANPRFATA